MGPHAAVTSDTPRVRAFSGTCLGDTDKLTLVCPLPQWLQTYSPDSCQSGGWQVGTSLSLAPSKGDSPHLLSGPQSPSATRPLLLATLLRLTVLCLLTCRVTCIIRVMIPYQLQTLEGCCPAIHSCFLCLGRSFSNRNFSCWWNGDLLFSFLWYVFSVAFKSNSFWEPNTFSFPFIGFNI